MTRRQWKARTHRRSRKVNGQAPVDIGQGYELVVSYPSQFYDWSRDKAIAETAGLKEYDTGCGLSKIHSWRDLMFSCEGNKRLALQAAKRVLKADHFSMLKIEISYPDVKENGHTFTPWYDASGALLRKVQHRKLARTLIIKRAPAPKKRRRKAA